MSHSDISMKTISTASYIRIVFAVMALVLALTWGANSAHAQEGERDSGLSIAPSGQIIAKGARVIAVTGNVLTVETTWGAAKISWTLQTTGSTKFTPDLGSTATVNSMKPGQTISFSGTISPGSAKPTVLAASLKNDDLIREAVSVLGRVESVDTEGGTFVVRTQDGETTVRVGGGTLMSKDGGYMNIRDIEVGDSSRATGTLDTTSGVLSAARITLKTGEPVVVAEDAGDTQESMLASLMLWLKGSRGILSVRDR